MNVQPSGKKADRFNADGFALDPGKLASFRANVDCSRQEAPQPMEQGTVKVQTETSDKSNKLLQDVDGRQAFHQSNSSGRSRRDLRLCTPDQTTREGCHCIC